MQGKWDNANTRENARVFFFDVFKNGDSTLLGKPRDSGKSKVSVGVYLCILANYYLPQSIIINGPKAKRRIYNGLHRVLIDNQVFRRDYGDIISSKSKMEGVFELHAELVFDCFNRTGYVTDDPIIQISVYSGIIGAHPYVVWLEDMLQSVFKSLESNEYLLYEVFDAIIQKLSDRIGGTFTRKGMDDLYSQLPSRNILLLTRGAIKLVKGRWPSINDLVYDIEGRAVDIKINPNSRFEIIERPGWTIKSLLIMRTLALKDPRNFEMWEREMQNNPILSEGVFFRRLKIPEVEPFTRGELANAMYMIVDPASGKSARSSDTAIVIIGLFNGLFYIVEIIIDKFNDTELYNECARLHRKYNPLMSWIENDFQQITKNTWLYNKLMRLRGFGVFYSKGYGEKLARIEQLYPPLSQKLFRIYSTATNQTQLDIQLRTYNQSEGRFDGLDVLSSGYRLLEKMLNIDDNEYRIERL